MPQESEEFYILIVVPYMAIILWRDHVTCRRPVATMKQES